MNLYLFFKKCFLIISPISAVLLMLWPIWELTNLFFGNYVAIISVSLLGSFAWALLEIWIPAVFQIQPQLAPYQREH